MPPPPTRWTWQQPDWPRLRYDPAPLQAAEARFLKGAGVVIGSIGHLDGHARQGLVVGLMAQDMADSSAIGGELLDRASLQSSIARQLGFAADARRASPAEAGAAKLMADLYRRWAEPLSEAQLFAWHAMLMNGRRDLAAVGAYRTHEDAMQIVSGRLHAPRVHFEAPPSAADPHDRQGRTAELDLGPRPH